jgi:hypothetical protein
MIRGHSGTPLGRALEPIAADIVEDREGLLAIMKRLGVPARQYKVWTGWVMETVGRLKSNGRLVGRSPLTSVLELEFLRLGVEGKAAAGGRCARSRRTTSVWTGTSSTNCWNGPSGRSGRWRSCAFGRRRKCSGACDACGTRSPAGGDPMSESTPPSRAEREWLPEDETSRTPGPTPSAAEGERYPEDESDSNDEDEAGTAGDGRG